MAGMQHDTEKFWHAPFVRNFYLGMGADPDETNTDKQSKNTPLMYAARGGHKRIAVALLDYGAAVNRVNVANESALHHACHRGQTAMIEFLLDEGCDCNVTDRQGVTALIICAQNGDLKSVEALLAFGASPLQRRFEDHLTPLEIAQKLPDSEDKVEMVRMLAEGKATAAKIQQMQMERILREGQRAKKLKALQKYQAKRAAAKAKKKDQRFKDDQANWDTDTKGKAKGKAKGNEPNKSAKIVPMPGKKAPTGLWTKEDGTWHFNPDKDEPPPGYKPSTTGQRRVSTCDEEVNYAALTRRPSTPPPALVVPQTTAGDPRWAHALQATGSASPAKNHMFARHEQKSFAPFEPEKWARECEKLPSANSLKS
jgi:hypothetical protein